MLRIPMLLAVILMMVGVSSAWAEDGGRVLRPDEMAAMSNGTYREGGHSFTTQTSRVLSASRRYGGTTRWRNNRLWCADYANRVLDDVGIKGTGSRLARDFLKWGTKVHSPQPGDVVVLSRGKRGNAGHVGFFMRYEGSKIVIHSGNTRSSETRGRTVAEGAYPMNRVLGIRRAPTMMASL